MFVLSAHAGLAVLMKVFQNVLIIFIKGFFSSKDNRNSRTRSIPSKLVAKSSYER